MESGIVLGCHGVVVSQRCLQLRLEYLHPCACFALLQRDKSVPPQTPFEYATDAKDDKMLALLLKNKEIADFHRLH